MDAGRRGRTRIGHVRALTHHEFANRKEIIKCRAGVELLKILSISVYVSRTAGGLQQDDLIAPAMLGFIECFIGVIDHIVQRIGKCSADTNADSQVN